MTLFTTQELLYSMTVITITSCVYKCWSLHIGIFCFANLKITCWQMNFSQPVYIISNISIAVLQYSNAIITRAASFNLAFYWNCAFSLWIASSVWYTALCWLHVGQHTDLLCHCVFLFYCCYVVTNRDSFSLIWTAEIVVSHKSTRLCLLSCDLQSNVGPVTAFL